MAEEFEYSRNIVTVDCCECGATFAMPASLCRARKRDGKMFYCPAGHTQYFEVKHDEEIASLQKEVERLREQLAQTQVARDWQARRVESRDRSIASLRGQITKLKRRK